jgi:hypothetical protein
MTPTRIEIKELDLYSLRPNEESINTTDGGMKISIIGKPGCGKSVLIKAIIPVGTAISESESTNYFYSKFMPSLFINDKFSLSLITDVKTRQVYAKKYLTNSWSILVLDDCMADTKLFNDKIIVDLLKNSRHWNLFTIFANQYVLDFKPSIRQCIDGVFILREPLISTRKKIYDNFASIIPSFQLFNKLMDELTQDFTCIYINNQSSSNNWQDCVFYYKAPLLDELEFGCQEYKDFAIERTMTED